MSKIFSKVEDLIGNTPIVKLDRFKNAYGLKGNIYAKLEFYNPAGSVKDRIALAMIEDAKAKGLLKDGATIIEPTSGNTGIGLASVGKAMGYEVILTMPETMSIERRNLLKAYGAQVVLTDGTQGMRGAIAEALALSKTIKDSFIPSQFENYANSKSHYATTGPEIWEDMEGQVDALVSGIGTGGTITGAGEYLREQKPDIKIYAVEPTDSAVLSGKGPGPHRIQGLGAGFVPEILNTKIYDEVISVSNEDAYKYGAAFPKIEGMLIGISSGAALWAATQLAMREEYEGKNILVIFPDNGERYLSTDMYDA